MAATRLVALPNKRGSGPRRPSGRADIRRPRHTHSVARARSRLAAARARTRSRALPAGTTSDQATTATARHMDSEARRVAAERRLAVDPRSGAPACLLPGAVHAAAAARLASARQPCWAVGGNASGVRRSDPSHCATARLQPRRRRRLTRRFLRHWLHHWRRFLGRPSRWSQLCHGGLRACCSHRPRQPLSWLPSIHPFEWRLQCGPPFRLACYPGGLQRCRLCLAAPARLACCCYCRSQQRSGPWCCLHLH